MSVTTYIIEVKISLPIPLYAVNPAANNFYTTERTNATQFNSLSRAQIFIERLPQAVRRHCVITPYEPCEGHAYIIELNDMNFQPSPTYIESIHGHHLLTTQHPPQAVSFDKILSAEKFVRNHPDVLSQYVVKIVKIKGVPNEDTRSY